jgi:lipoate-protein ligase A
MKVMKSKSIYKVPNGKLLKIFLDYDQSSVSINSVCITGDFFAYPEESIEIMEKRLKNSKLNRKHLIEKIQFIINENDIEFIGLDAQGLTDGILMCLK